MATTPQYSSVPNVGAALLTTGDTSRTAPSTTGTIMTAGSSGSRCDNIDFVATATTVASAVRIFLYDGSTYHMLTEKPVVAVTASTGVVWELHLGTQYNPDIFPIEIKSGWSIRATVNDTQTGIKAIARGGDF